MNWKTEFFGLEKEQKLKKENFLKIIKSKMLKKPIKHESINAFALKRCFDGKEDLGYFLGCE